MLGLCWIDEHVKAAVWIWFPATCSRDRKMVHNSILILASRHHVSDASLVRSIYSAQLRNLPIWKQAFIKLVVVHSAIDLP